MILDSRVIKYDVVDIAEPGNEEQKDFMQNNSTSLGATVSDTTPRHPLPPQIFSNDLYCGVCNYLKNSRWKDLIITSFDIIFLIGLRSI